MASQDPFVVRIASLAGVSADRAEAYVEKVLSHLPAGTTSRQVAEAVETLKKEKKRFSSTDVAEKILTRSPVGTEPRIHAPPPSARPASTREALAAVRGPDPENPESERAFQALTGKAPAVFVTGRAGTGKSYLLRYFARNSRKRAVFLAPTGLAAVNIGGQTIHSFFKFPPRLLNPTDIRSVTDTNRRLLYRAIDVLVIDEVSMVNANLIDAVDQFMRKNGRDSRRPFGGAQLALFGDPFQLPPVVTREDEAKFLTFHYHSPFFFDAHVFRELPVEIIELQKNYRQKDAVFMDLLNAIRAGSMTRDHQERLNARYQPDFVPSHDEIVPVLTTTNDLARKVNEEELRRLPPPEHVFPADISGEFRSEALPADTELHLREGAQVIFVKNDNQKRWVNGTFGRVVRLDDEIVDVEVLSKGHPYVYRVDRETWSNLEYDFDPKTGRIEAREVGKLTQYPIRPAWAITIHKSQGQTLERVAVDIGSGAFEHGQVYVALSRCPTLDGITLKREVWQNDVLKVSSRVQEFMRECRFGGSSGPGDEPPVAMMTQRPDELYEVDGERYAFRDGQWFREGTFIIPAAGVIQKLSAARRPIADAEDAAIKEFQTLIDEAKGYRDRGDLSRAERLLKRAVGMKPGHPGAVTVLCSLRRAQKQPSLAVKETRDAAMRSTYAPLLTCYAAALCDIERWDEAKECLDRLAIAGSKGEGAVFVENRIRGARPDLFEFDGEES